MKFKIGDRVIFKDKAIGDHSICEITYIFTEGSGMGCYVRDQRGTVWGAQFSQIKIYQDPNNLLKGLCE